MVRRKLALYTLLYIAGITTGFFMFERSRTLEAAGFSAAVIVAVFFTDLFGNSKAFPLRNVRNDPDHAARHRSIKQEVLERQRAVLALLFLAGFIVFAFRSLSYNAALSYVHDKNYIRGKVNSVTVKDSKLQIIIKNSGIGPSKVLVTLDALAADRSYGKLDYSSEDRTAFEALGADSYIGETVEARGEFTEIAPADNPGCFDYRLYMRSKGVTIRFKAYVLEVTDSDVPLSAKVRRYLYRARESFIGRFDEDTQGFIRGVIFGDKSEIDDELLEEFNNNSTGHILAVSGLHMGFLYGLLRFLTARKRTLPVSMLIISVIMLYSEMTMWSPATVRACIVMTISLCSTHFRRCADLLTSLSLAAFMILTYQPYQLFNSGFQLSFLALSGIAFLTKPISTVTGEAIAVMLAVQVGTLPVIAYSYCRINPLSMLINVPVILLASVLVPLCILLLMLEAGIGMVPSFGIDIAELISYAVMKINHILEFEGFFSIKTAGPGAAAIIMVYIAAFGLVTEWTKVMIIRKEYRTIIKQGILLLLPVTMLFSCLYDPLSNDEIVFVAVGQGDCTHIRADAHSVLIDGGGQVEYGSDKDEESGQNKDSSYNVGKSILMPYLMHSGADNVDIALVTHLHADHYKGIVELCDVFPVGAIGVPVDYRGASDIMPDESEIHYIGPYTKIEISEDVSIEAIWPVDVSNEPMAADDPNEHNTVYMIYYNDIKIMVTGDLLEEDEQEMVKYYEGSDKLKCDILKVAHHGSKSSSCEEFLNAARPRIAVIQCGRNNFYGHPHQQTLDRLEERGIKVFRTDISGAVGIDIHGTRISVDLFH